MSAMPLPVFLPFSKPPPHPPPLMVPYGSLCFITSFMSMYMPKKGLSK